MDKREMLNKIIDSLIAGDDAAAKTAFSEFSTLKTSEIIQGSSGGQQVVNTDPPVVEPEQK